MRASNLNSLELVIPRDCHGLRLDQALARLVPGAGRRGARRILGECRVEVDGRFQAAGYRVSEGQRVRIQECVHVQERGLAEISGEGSPRVADVARVRVAAQNADFAALVKPAGMHCERLRERPGVALSGKMPGRSGLGDRQALGEVLPELFPGALARLMNRLDQAVSGLVLAALHPGAARDYAAWQEQGLVRKRYLALVAGRVGKPVVVRAALDTAQRRKVRVLAREEPDRLRWTRLSPASSGWPAQSDVTLVQVEILKGRRHQIRAHLASIGHPVLHDPLYGTGPDLGWIGLHHAEIILPGFRAESRPGWLESAGPNDPVISGQVR